MRVDGLAIVLRPRTQAEACDLGLALVRAHAASIWRCFTPLLLALRCSRCARWTSAARCPS